MLKPQKTLSSLKMFFAASVFSKRSFVGSAKQIPFVKCPKNPTDNLDPQSGSTKSTQQVCNKNLTKHSKNLRPRSAKRVNQIHTTSQPHHKDANTIKLLTQDPQSGSTRPAQQACHKIYHANYKSKSLTATLPQFFIRHNWYTLPKNAKQYRITMF